MEWTMFLQHIIRMSTFSVALVFCAAPSSEARSTKQKSVIIAWDARAPIPTQAPGFRGRTFVPLHSSLIGQAGVKRLDFSGTLSVHNTSATNALVIDRIEYRNGSGEPVETYVSDRIALRPYGSLQVIIAQKDVRGGTGASFTVDWSTFDRVDDPVIEALMAAPIGTRGYSFLSLGRKVSRPE